MKDSSNDVALQSELLARHPELRFFPINGRNADRGKALRCCRMHFRERVPVAASRARGVCTGRCLGAQRLRKRALRSPAAPLIELVRTRVAKKRNDDAWLRAMPPN